MNTIVKNVIMIMKKVYKYTNNVNKGKNRRHSRTPTRYSNEKNDTNKKKQMINIHTRKTE